jgi:hypothetical protein
LPNPRALPVTHAVFPTIPNSSDESITDLFTHR